jgi:hypothetical protein
MDTRKVEEQVLGALREGGVLTVQELGQTLAKQGWGNFHAYRALEDLKARGVLGTRNLSGTPGRQVVWIWSPMRTGEAAPRITRGER